MNYPEERAEHYRRIRTDPSYRMCEMIADIEAQQAPAWSIPVTQEREEQIIEHNLTGQWKGRILYLENKIMEMRIARRKPNKYKLYK